MDRLIKALFQIQEFKFRTDDDFVDRLNRQYTPTVLVLFTILVSVRQYVGDPISCWCPAQFTQAHVDYTNTVCWVSDTYYVPMKNTLPLPDQPRDTIISYYQWVPIILLCQACLYFMPCVFWRFLNRRVGINLSAIVEAAQSIQKAIYIETKEKTLRYIVLQIDSYLMRQHRTKKGACGRVLQTLAQYCCLFCGKFYGNYLTATYLLTKVLYILNSIAQLFLLDIFLGFRNNFHLYGIHVLAKLFTGNDWSSSERFPRITMCDFQIRQQQNVHKYTVQCVLPINLFNEKIFIFIWFWLLFVALSSIISLVHWIIKSAILPMQVSYIKRQLRAMDLFDKRESKNAKKFTEQYLRRDGLFIVRMIAKNAGELVAAELLQGMWLNFGPDRRATAAETYNDIARRRKQTRPISQEIGSRWKLAKRIITRGKTRPDEEEKSGSAEEEPKVFRPEDI